MERAIKRKTAIMRLAVALLCLVFLTLGISTGILGRYTTGDNDGDSARVAHFAFTARGSGSESFTLDLSDIKHPGTSSEYRFTVSNAREAIVSEVSQKISAGINATGELPLLITLRDAESDTVLISIDTESLRTANAELISFSPRSAEVHEYIIRIEWSAEDSDASLMDKKTEITLSVTAEQTN